VSFEPTPTHTAAINPELLGDRSMRMERSVWITVFLCLVIVAGFGFRVVNLGAESLSEDELNKLMAVADYRANGLTSANGEHPMLMKVAQTITVTAAEKWNGFGFVLGNPSLHVSVEASLRFPCVLLGAFTALLLYLLFNPLFGSRIALLTAALWALDPNAIAFNRIGKEDTFALFFFILANIFWLRAQRIAETHSGRFVPYYWATAAAFGAMVASKYLIHFLAISVGYYFIFQGIPATRWRLGRPKYLLFFAVMGLTFALCSPAIFLPATWHQMFAFFSEHRIGHDAYEFMGTLYTNKFTLWFHGIPWYFYFAYILFKTPIPLLVAFVVGVPQLFMKRLGDGRYFVIVWMFFWFFPFSVIGGKFTRYFTSAMPLIHITAAIGIYWVAGSIAARFSGSSTPNRSAVPVFASLAFVVLIFSAVASASVSPNFRLYTNALGGGWNRSGDYFPHDEFYDGATRDVVAIIAQKAAPGALVLTETPGLYAYYLRLAGRTDVEFASLSDPVSVARVRTGDLIVIARGRRYFSNERVTAILDRSGIAAVPINLGPVTAVRLFQLNDVTAKEIASGR
jgi:hypothetical protein